MLNIKMAKSIFFVASLSLFTACTSDQLPIHENGYYYNDIFFGINLSSDYQKGIRDGCTTAKGNYTKSHRLFNNNHDYNNGWFLGRNKCRHLLVVVDEE